ncbi:unnamed protein product, partial [Ectocarpus fasciculatus]
GKRYNTIFGSRQVGSGSYNASCAVNTRFVARVAHLSGRVALVCYETVCTYIHTPDPISRPKQRERKSREKDDRIVTIVDSVNNNSSNNNNNNNKINRLQHRPTPPPTPTNHGSLGSPPLSPNHHHLHSPNNVPRKQRLDRLRAPFG